MCHCVGVPPCASLFSPRGLPACLQFGAFTRGAAVGVCALLLGVNLSVHFSGISAQVQLVVRVVVICLGFFFFSL